MSLAGAGRAVAGSVLPTVSTVLVDGPSGAGKSTLATALAAALAGRTPRLLRLDDHYRGWRDLAATAATVERRVLAPRRRGAAGRLPLWDWGESRVRGSATIAPGGLLIVEGCGASTAADVDASTLRVWVTAPDESRRSRALARDGGLFDPWWDVWEEQWRALPGRRGAERRADVVVAVGDPGVRVRR